MRSFLIVLAVALVGCGEGSTGSGLVTFAAFGTGPSDVVGTHQFETALGYEVELTEARLLVGGLYVNQNTILEGAQEQPCVLPGLYVAEVTTGRELDLLDGSPEKFPASGVGIEERGRSAEVWLKADNVDINAPDDSRVVASARGTARRAGQTWPFSAQVTIGANRRQPDPDPDKPGANPICAERIVSRIPVEVTPRGGGHLVLRVDPSKWFAQVKFEDLEAPAADGTFMFPDAPDGQPAIALFNGLKSVTAYSVEWRATARPASPEE